MTIRSMTGFARSQGQATGAVWAWELKTVNAKGFDLRLRLPPGFDAVEAEARRMIGTVIGRGTVHAALDLARPDRIADVRINEPLLRSLAEKLTASAKSAGLPPPSMDALLGVRGVIEAVDPDESPEENEALSQAILSSLEEAIVGLCAMREREGGALQGILEDRIAGIGTLARQADQLPSRSAEAVRARLHKQIEDLLGSASAEQLDSQRLHQEAMMIAVKADIREELDRLASHVMQVSDLLKRGGAIGRRLDFLAQELSRETNTLCAKSNDMALTAIGIDLKTLVEQLREQVQNVE
jgi:uncharacterized protein (TIGR00255 family)